MKNYSKFFLVILSVLLAITTLQMLGWANTAADELGRTTRVSVNSSGAQANNRSARSAVSADGRFVAFQSYATNLIPGGTNNKGQVFFHDRWTGTTTLISVNSNGGQGNYVSDSPDISGDGRFVAFYSYATNLVPEDINDQPDIFVHDRQTGTTTRVSVNSSGMEGNFSASQPRISANGRFVAFASSATNLVLGDTNDRPDIFVRDRQTGETSRVSVNTTGTQANLGASEPVASADGRFVAFASTASNLVSDDTNGAQDVFVHDRQTNITTRVSVSSNGEQGNNYSHHPDISADGRFVVFPSKAGNLVPGDNDSVADVFVHDRQTGETTRVGVDASGVGGSTGGGWPSISPDGRYVAFSSEASNGDPRDTTECKKGSGYENCTDVFVHDMQTHDTTLFSLDSSGVQGNNHSANPSISMGGEVVAFESMASNLVSNDSNDQEDIFVYALTQPPPTFMVSGKVTDRDGNSLSGATIALDNGATTLSDENGEYEFNDLAAGTYNVSASHSDYEMSPSSRVTTVPPDKNNVDFVGQKKNVPTDPCKIVQGHVYSAITNKPLKGVKITINNLVAGSATTTTDENGRFALSWNNQTQSHLSAQLEGYKTATTVVGKKDYCPTYSLVMWPKAPVGSKNDEIAKEYAPVWKQGVDKRDPDADFITNFDFDYNWNGNDNWQNQSYSKLLAHIYYSVVETKTHYFILYADFHPRDWGEKFGITCTGPKIFLDYISNCHENDMEGALVVVRKIGDGGTRIEYLETVFHDGFERYYRPELQFQDETHPILAVEAMGHGVQGLKKNTEIEADWIITYVVGDRAQEPSKTKKDQTINYELIPIDDQLWPRRHDYRRAGDEGSTYDSWGYFSQDEHNLYNIARSLGVAAHPPWGWTDAFDDRINYGDFFFDPAYVIDIHFDGPGNFDRNYTFNPYLTTMGIIYKPHDPLVTKQNDDDSKTAIISNDGATTVLVPADAVENSVVITHELSSDEAYYGKGALAGAAFEGNTISGIREVVLHPFEISAEDLETKAQIAGLQKDYVLTVEYTDRDVANFDEESLQLYRWTGSRWKAEPNSRLDTEENTVSLLNSKFGIFAVLGVPEHEVFSPAVMKAKSR